MKVADEDKDDVSLKRTAQSNRLLVMSLAFDIITLEIFYLSPKAEIDPVRLLPSH